MCCTAHHNVLKAFALVEPFHVVFMDVGLDAYWDAVTKTVAGHTAAKADCAAGGDIYRVVRHHVVAPASDTFSAVSKSGDTRRRVAAPASSVTMVKCAVPSLAPSMAGPER